MSLSSVLPHLKDHTPSVQRVGALQVFIDREGARQYVLGKQVYSPLGRAKLRRVDLVVTAGAATVAPTLMRLRIGNADNVNVANDSTQSPTGPRYADYFTIPIAPTAGMVTTRFVSLDLSIGELFIGKKVPVDCFFTDLADVAVPMSTVLGATGVVILYLEHGGE